MVATRVHVPNAVDTLFSVCVRLAKGLTGGCVGAGEVVAAGTSLGIIPIQGCVSAKDRCEYCDDAISINVIGRVILLAKTGPSLASASSSPYSRPSSYGHE